MSYYDDVQSMLLCRGEQLFPFTCFVHPVDFKEVLRCWEVIIASYDRFMTSDEVLKLYD